MRSKNRRSWKRKLQVLLLLSACWPLSGSVRLACLIYHVKYISSNIIFCRCIWDHPRITCPSHLPTADRTASVTITPVRKSEKLVFFIDGLFLANKSQKSPKETNEPKTTQWELQENYQVNWIRPPIYFFVSLKTFSCEEDWPTILNVAPFFEWQIWSHVPHNQVCPG